MIDIGYDKNGMPSVVITSKAMITTEEAPKTNVKQVIEPVTMGSKKIIPWELEGGSNDFPEVAIGHRRKTSVLNRSLINYSKTILGQGPYPVRLKEFDQSGYEVLEVVKDPEILSLMNNFSLRNYLARSVFNRASFGNAWVELIFNLEGSKMTKLFPINSRWVRITEDGKEVVVSNKFPELDTEGIRTLTLLDEIDPLGHLIQLRDAGYLKTNSVVMQLKNPFSNNDYYSEPDWLSALEWVKISQKIPIAISSGMDNMLQVYLHVKIPYSYFEMKFPRDAFGTDAEHKTAIESFVKQLDEKLTMSKNARKTLITYFSDDKQGADKWDIEIIEHKFNQENIINSTASDTQIAIASGIMPDLLGLMYGNSKGGSMQRELLLIAYALAWEERQALADPIELMIRFNYGDKYADVQVKFRNTFLTTLDSGKGTDQVIS